MSNCPFVNAVSLKYMGKIQFIFKHNKEHQATNSVNDY